MKTIKKHIENVTKAIDNKDLAELASVCKQRLVVLEGGKPDWPTIKELWGLAQHGAQMPMRAMRAEEALAKTSRHKTCPVSGAPILSSGKSSEYPRLDFSGLDSDDLEKIARGCKIAKSFKTVEQVVDLVAAYLDPQRGSAEFESFTHQTGVSKGTIEMREHGGSYGRQVDQQGKIKEVVKCPFCGADVVVFVRSFAEVGKNCKCGAHLTHGGECYKKGSVGRELQLAPGARLIPSSGSGPLRAWQDKLSYLLEAEATTADHDQRYSLMKRIAEARAKVRELGG